MKKTVRFLLWISLLIPVLSFGQALTVNPAFPTADADITLIFDLTKVRDARATSLLGRTGDVYLWAWGGSNPADRSKPEYTLDALTKFDQPYAPALLTSLGNNRWSIRLNPRKFLNLGPDKLLRWFGCLVKSGNGSAQTEDFTFVLYPPTLNVAFFTPGTKTLSVEAGSSLLVKAQASARATLTLTLDGQPVTSSTDTLLTANVPVGAASTTPRRLKITATANGQMAADSILLSVQPAPIVESLPAGLRDGINYHDGNAATLVLYAPGKKSVYLLGEFNNWETRPEYLMRRVPDGQSPDGQRFWLRLDGLTAGQEVAFQYLVDGQIPVGDPYAEKILDRQNDGAIPSATYPNLKPFPAQARGNIVSVLQPGKTPYAWQVTSFQRPSPDNLVIYELLVRDFTAAGNYTALTDTLPYLKRLGVNAVELMPINEFTNNDSWGYNPTYYLAPDKAYGPETALKRFIDESHRAGIAVILDVVFNHADYEFPYVKMYWDGQRPSTDSPMFNPEATHPFSVFFDFNHDAPATRAHMDRAIEHWLKTYRVDGFRFDLSKGFTQKKTSGDDQFRLFDASRVANLKRVYDQLRTLDPTAYVILEHFAEDREEQELTNHGMLVWGNANGDFRAAVKGTGGNFSRISYKNHGFAKPRLVSYLESHDEERVIYDALQNGANSDLKTLKTALERAKAAAALLLLTPGPKMIWQFGELGYDVNIDFNGRTGRKPIRWEYQRDPDRLKLYKVYAELIKLKLAKPIFKSTEFSTTEINSVQHLSIQDGQNRVKVVANFTTRPQETANPFVISTSAGTPNPPVWYDYFTGKEIRLSDVENQNQITYQSGEFHVYTTERVAVSEQGLVPWSGATTAVTALEPVRADETLWLYPNPSREVLILELESAYTGAVDLEINDVAGRRLSHFHPHKDHTRLVQHLPIRELPQGLYLLRIDEGPRQTVRKFVKE
ncbi:MAG: T9SS type A sorting domain-containing protein [Cytophagaceae bacterium]|nr:T9SS type A sorting domain-containing protein [Cytophagaceae bacterium]